MPSTVSWWWRRTAPRRGRGGRGRRRRKPAEGVGEDEDEDEGRDDDGFGFDEEGKGRDAVEDKDERDEGGKLPRAGAFGQGVGGACLLYTSPSPRDATLSRMPSSA